MGVVESTSSIWHNKYGRLVVAELQRLRYLEEEDRTLKQLVVDLSLDKAMLQEVISQKL